MPTNLYGPGDNFDLQNSHVIPALIRKIHEAKIQNQPTVEVWGNGKAKREFLHVDDLADACFHVMHLPVKKIVEFTEPMLSHINIGTGEDVSIKELAKLLIEVVGYNSEISWNTAMPEGTPRKLLDVECLANLGWRAKIGLKQGLTDTYRWFLENYDSIRGSN